MKVHYIDSFRFKQAEYSIGDGNGAEVILRMDYKNNSFELRGNNTTANKHFLEEVQQIAHDLLERKHGVNFAER